MAKPTPIRVVVETVSSERDTGGNTYHVCHLFNPAKGRGARVSLEVGGPSSARSLAYKLAGGDWEAVLSLESTLPKRAWREHRSMFQVLNEHSAEAAAALQALMA